MNLVHQAKRLLTLSAHLLCALLLTAFATPRCAAATYYVSTTGNDSNTGDQSDPYLTIQYAIANAASGDTVIVENGTYSGVGNVDIDFDGHNITLTSQNGASSTVIDCGGSNSTIHRGFYLHGGEGTNAPAVINGLTVKNGYESNNSRGGGAMFIASTDNITVQNCVFTSNSCTLNGGAIENDGSLALTNCILSTNTTSASGGGLNSTGAATLNNSTFSGNTASQYGGGVFSSGSASLMNCACVSNTSGRSGGGCYNYGTMTITGCSFTSNVATTVYSGDGGGGFVTNGTGGFGTATLLNSTIKDNTSGQTGGGIYNYRATLTLTGCDVSGNTATQNIAGGLYNDGGSNARALQVSFCTFSGNNAPNSDGGAMYLTQEYASDNDTVLISDCLIVGNSAGNNGGGIYNSYDALTVQFSTSTGNTASGAGGGLYDASGTSALTDDILYNDIGGEAVDETTSGNSISLNYCDVNGGFAGTKNFDKNPKFVNSSGGDYHLQAISPCIGTGTPIMGVTTDLDGMTRANPPSIGAYEGSARTATKVTVANTSGTAGQSVTLSATLTATSGGSLSGKTLTFTVDGASGTATSSSSGVASLSYPIPSTDSGGAHTITVSFAGDNADAASSGTGTLTVSAVTYPYQVRYFPRVGKESRMVGGQFQGSNDNTAWTTLYTVTQTPPDAYTTAALAIDPATFRYLRYLAPNGSYGNVAEIEFDSHGTKLTGIAIFGTPGTYNNDGLTFENALDGNTNTYFDAPAPGNGDFFGIDQGPSGPTYTELIGTDYGTSGSYNNDGLTFQNALDGNLSTYFDAPAPGNGDTVGIDLGASNQKVVTRIDFCPRSGYGSRMVGGVFQGSNGHGVFTTLYTVTSAPATGVLTRVPISNSTAYRYVQYVAPNGSYGNVAEVEFDTSP